MLCTLWHVLSRVGDSSHDVLVHAENCRRKEKKEKRRAEKRKEKAKGIESNGANRELHCRFPSRSPVLPSATAPVALLQSSQP